MPPDILYNTISTQRMVPSGGIKKQWVNNLTGLACLIQPITPEYAQKTGMIFDRSYFCIVQTGADIQIGNRVTDQSGKNYEVTGSRNINYGYNVQHVTYLLSEEAQATPDI